MSEYITDKQDELLYSMFNFAKKREDTWMRFSQIKSFDGSEIDFKSVIIDDLVDNGFVKKRFVDEDEREFDKLATLMSSNFMKGKKPQEYSITVEGIEHINFSISRGSGHLSQLIKSANNGIEENISTIDIPASDRVVTLKHNQSEYREISDGLDNAIEEVKSIRTNDVSADDIKSQLASLEAARKLWDAFELTAMQYKVGIILAVEKAEIILKKSFKLVKGGLLLEAIKAFCNFTKDEIIK